MDLDTIQDSAAHGHSHCTANPITVQERGWQPGCWTSD